MQIGVLATDLKVLYGCRSRIGFEREILQNPSSSGCGKTPFGVGVGDLVLNWASDIAAASLLARTLLATAAHHTHTPTDHCAVC